MQEKEGKEGRKQLKYLLSQPDMGLVSLADSCQEPEREIKAAVAPVLHQPLLALLPLPSPLPPPGLAAGWEQRTLNLLPSPVLLAVLEPVRAGTGCSSLTQIYSCINISFL